MDALPVIERTGLPYASKVRVRDKNGNEVGVMHACGHDMHMTCWTSARRASWSALKDRWQGTLVFIGQPAEEIGAGAAAMLEDGLFKHFPEPGLLPGPALRRRYAARARRLHAKAWRMANVDSVDIIVRGKGGHGCGAAHDDRSDRAGRPHRARSADDRQPGTQSARPGRGHGRLDPRRHQAQHHPRRGASCS